MSLPFSTCEFGQHGFRTYNTFAADAPVVGRGVPNRFEQSNVTVTVVQPSRFEIDEAVSILRTHDDARLLEEGAFLPRYTPEPSSNDLLPPTYVEHEREVRRERLSDRFLYGYVERMVVDREESRRAVREGRAARACMSVGLPSPVVEREVSEAEMSLWWCFFCNASAALTAVLLFVVCFGLSVFIAAAGSKIHEVTNITAT